MIDNKPWVDVSFGGRRGAPLFYLKDYREIDQDGFFMGMNLPGGWSWCLSMHFSTRYTGFLHFGFFPTDDGWTWHVLFKIGTLNVSRYPR